VRTRTAVALVAGATALVSVVALAVAGSTAASGSALSRGATGWAAARAYVQARGTEVALLDRPLDAVPEGTRVLVLAFPWQRWEPSDVRRTVSQHLRDGGDVVFAFSGDAPFTGDEQDVADALGLTSRLLRDAPPLSPFGWRRHVLEEWTLPVEGARSSIRLRAYRRGLDAPEGAAVLAREPDGRPAAFVFARHRGRVAVLPAAALANAALGQPGAADLLETLRSGLAGRWTFAEHPHGLVAPGSPAAAGSRRIFDLWLLHLAVVYALALVALARPFGPVWSDPPQRTGSAAAFLRGLGGLHRRLGHERRAVELLEARSRELDPRLAARASALGPGASLLARAQETAGWQRSPGRRDA
jgi:uncharacterized protein DUF4350